MSRAQIGVMPGVGGENGNIISQSLANEHDHPDLRRQQSLIACIERPFWPGRIRLVCSFWSSTAQIRSDQRYRNAVAISIRPSKALLRSPPFSTADFNEINRYPDPSEFQYGNRIGKMWSWFGGAAAQKRKDAPKNAILMLREQLDMLQKREKHLQNQMEEQEAVAKKNIAANKTGELLVL